MGWIRQRLSRKKWKRLCLYGSAAFLVLLVLDLGWVRYWRRITISPEITGINVPLNASGTPDYVTALNRRYGQGVTPDTNALVPLLKILSTQQYAPLHRQLLLAELGMSENQTANSEVYPFLQWALQLPAAQKLSRHDLETQDDELGTHPWRRDDKPLWWQWLSQQQQGLADLRQAVLKPHLYIPFFPPQDHVHGLIGDYDDEKAPIRNLTPILSPARMLADILRADALRCAGEGDWPRLREDILTLCRLSRLINQGPTVIGALVAVAIDAKASDIVFKTLSTSVVRHI